jgi:hypothetical protein
MQRGGSKMSGELRHQVVEPGKRPSVPITVPLVIVLAAWALALLTYRPWTPGPRTLRGRFDHLQIGMRMAVVRVVMGRPGDDPPSCVERQLVLPTVLPHSQMLPCP